VSPNLEIEVEQSRCIPNEHEMAEVVPVASDDKLKEILQANSSFSKKFTKKAGWSDMTQIIADLSVNEFFETFFGSNAKFGLV